MGDDMVAIVAIIFGVTFIGYIFYKITDLIKAWINRKKNPYDEEKFERLAKAFIKYKKESKQRLQNLEAIISEDETGPTTSSGEPLSNAPLYNTPEVVKEHSKEEHEADSSSGLQNMLRE